MFFCLNYRLINSEFDFKFNVKHRRSTGLSDQFSTNIGLERPECFLFQLKVWDLFEILPVQNYF